MIVNIVLLGAPGSGKGTQAERLRQELGLRHIATGDLFRAHLKVPTKLGRVAGEYIGRGELVPDATTVQMLRQHLAADFEETSSEALFDGFPRTLEQAKALEKLLTERGRCVDGVVYVRVSADEIFERLSGRLICRKCQVPFHRRFSPFVSCPIGECESGECLYQRDDDLISTVLKRIDTFQMTIYPVVEHYRSRGLLHRIDGDGGVDEVYSKVVGVIDNIQGSLFTSIE